MYTSLIHPWSPPHLATASEHAYRAAGLIRTKGTIFLLPPPLPVLKSTYTTPPRPQTRMSAGAVALCKHFERGGASSEHGRPHPYWPVPRGSNERKTEVAREVLERLLNEEVVWGNVMLLHPGVAVYEVRNGRGWGMRWTLEVEEVEEEEEEEEEEGPPVSDSADLNTEMQHQQQHQQREPAPSDKNWRITKTTFRGFVEPIEGLDHELDGA